MIVTLDAAPAFRLTVKKLAIPLARRRAIR
jgi:hypothetical protein